jgi:peroxiredoxin
MKPGDLAPLVNLQDHNGNAFPLPFPAVLVFFKTTCPTCQFGLPFLNRAMDAARTKGAPLLAISQDPPNETNRFLSTWEVQLPVAFDRAEDGYPASNAFGLTHVPTVYELDSNGYVVRIIDGFDKAAYEGLGVVFQPAEAVPSYRPG